MNTNSIPYQPEDIEALLLAKSYKDLLAEEKQFVLQHLTSEQEYTTMRNTLLAIKQASENNQTITPDKKVKEDLLLLFEKKKTRGFWFFMERLFAFLFPANLPIFQRPGIQFASLAVLLVVGMVFVNQIKVNKEEELAIHTPNDFPIPSIKKELNTKEIEAVEEEAIETIPSTNSRANSKEEEISTPVVLQEKTLVESNNILAEEAETIAEVEVNGKQAYDAKEVNDKPAVARTAAVTKAALKMDKEEKPINLEIIDLLYTTL